MPLEQVEYHISNDNVCLLYKIVVMHVHCVSM